MEKDNTDIITPEDKKEKEIIPIDESIKGLTVKYDDLLDKNNKFLQIFTRAADPNANALVEFKTIDEKALTKIADRMPALNRACNVFGKQNSQTTGRMMSLQMISWGPYRSLKQILAKVERKRGALKENIFKLRKEKIQLDRLVSKRDKLREDLKDDPDNQDLYFDLEELIIDIEEKASNVADSSLYVEGALKEIGQYQDAYEQIMESHNIPEDWSEVDYEEAEIEEHVKLSFLHCIRDLEMTGRVNVGTHEYLSQYGIDPHTAAALVKQYLAEQEEMIQNGNYPGIEMLYKFLDNMYQTFGQEYKKAMKHIGIRELVSEDFLYKTNKDKESENEE